MLVALRVQVALPVEAVRKTFTCGHQQALVCHSAAGSASGIDHTTRWPTSSCITEDDALRFRTSVLLLKHEHHRLSPAAHRGLSADVSESVVTGWNYRGRASRTGGSAMSSFERGRLVWWITGGRYGVVLDVDGNRVTVRIDGDPEPKIFNSATGVIAQVDLSQQALLERRSTEEVGLNQGPGADGTTSWNVFVGGRLLLVPEADLRPYRPRDAASRASEGEFGTPGQFVLTVAARARLVDHYRSELMALAETRIDPKPHQVSVVHRVVSEFPHRFLLCDEVGLGKTIEAAMVLKELRARGAARRALVIVPPNLLRQWQFELKSRFNETFSILNTHTVRHLRNTLGFEGNPFEEFDSVLVSASWIKDPSVAEQAAEVDWDIVIVDEAHHARVRHSGRRREETRLYKAVRRLVAPDGFSQRAALLLTATPMQLDSRELYSLVELLDEALFPTEEHFHQHRQELPGLNKMVQDLQIHGFPIPGIAADDVVRQVAAWLRIEPAEAETRLMGTRETVDELCAELTGCHRLSEVLIRNRKSVVGGFMPRHAVRWKVKLTANEQRVLTMVQDYVRNGFALADERNDRAYGFLMTTFQKLMASSNRALRTSLNRRRERLIELAESPRLTRSARALIENAEERLGDDEFVSELLAEIGSAHEREAETLRSLVEELDSLTTDSKAEKLAKKLGELRDEHPDAKVLLFTEFRETQEYLSERLTASGWNVERFHGQLKPEQKDQAIERFRDSSQPTVLVSTEAGGEGRNLQFCHFLVNYDLPWNPMRVEQRIGRLDRIGQEHVVTIFNLSTKGTVEERVLDVLERRIQLFEETVGGLDPILGDTEKSLTKILKLSGERRDEALTRFERKVEQDVRAARDADEKLRDLIMEVRSYDSHGAGEILERRVPMDAETHRRLMIEMLALEHTHLDEQSDGTMILTFNNEFRERFPDIADGPNRRRHVSFRPDDHGDSEHVEYFTLGHPVVDEMIGRVTDGEYSGNCGAVTLTASELIEPGEGWLVIHQVTVPGPRDAVELVAVWVATDGPDERLGRRLLDHLATMPSASTLNVDTSALDESEGAIDLAGAAAQGHLAALEQAVNHSRTSRLDRDLQRLSDYFDVRREASGQRLAHAQQVLADVRDATDDDRRRIIPIWEANVRRAEQLIAELDEERHRRIDAAERQLFASGTVELVAVGRVRVQAPASIEDQADPR